jgi:hypothetical protein
MILPLASPRQSSHLQSKHRDSKTGDHREHTANLTGAHPPPVLESKQQRGLGRHLCTQDTAGVRNPGLSTRRPMAGEERGRRKGVLWNADCAVEGEIGGGTPLSATSASSVWQQPKEAAPGERGYRWACATCAARNG